MDVTILGTLLFTLTPAAVFFLVVGLGALAYLALIGTEALLPSASRYSLLVPAGACLAIVVGLVVLRVSDLLLVTALVAGASGAALVSSGMLLAAVGARARRTLAAGARQRELVRTRTARSAELGQAAERARLAAGDDIRDETRRAMTALDALKAALARLEAAHGQLEAAPASTDRERLAQDLSARIDLGRRALGEAEAAVTRLRASEPLRVLMRRRPVEAIRALSAAARGDGDLVSAAAAAAPTVRSFVDEVRAARRACDEHDDEAYERVAEELDAMESAYAPLLDRLRVLEIRLAADAGTAEVASATSAVSAHTKRAGLTQGEVDALTVEVGRADQALGLTVLHEGRARELRTAVERGAVALAKSDDASLSELLGALRDMG